MTYSVFNQVEYLELEAARQGGVSKVFDLGNGVTVGVIARAIANSRLRDLVSVYGYPDLATATPHLPYVHADAVLNPLSEAAREQGLVAGYLRLGMTQEVTAPSGTAGDYEAKRVDVGEVVVVDLTGGPDAAMGAYRKKLRNELRRPSKITIERSDDFVAFHRIYTENMKRVNAEGSYFFSPAYLEALTALPGVELWLVCDGQGIIAGGVFIRQGNLVFYHLGATGDRSLATSPLKHLLHHRIQDLARSGLRSLVLGGGVGGNDDPLLRFKRAFSKQTQPVHALHVIFDPAEYTRLSGRAYQPVSSSEFFPIYRAPNPA